MARVPNKRSTGVTYEDVKRVALALPGVMESTSYGTPALKVKGKLLVRLREEGDVIVVKMPFDRRAELIEGAPEIYYITDHYEAAEWVLVRLPQLSAGALPDLLGIAYRTATARRRKTLPS